MSPIRIILKVFSAGSKSIPVPHPTFTKGANMNARNILNPELRQSVNGLSLDEIRELHLKLERDVSELRVFLKLRADKKPASRSPRRPPDGWRGRYLN